MKYTSEITINQPIDQVIALFDNSDNLAKWQPELVSFEHIHGEPRHLGAESKMKYKMGNREVEMIETITRRNLPEEFAATYQAPGVVNWVSNKFVKMDDDTTKWISENEFKFKGIMMSMMAFFMPGAFKKQSDKFMQQFKTFAESSH